MIEEIIICWPVAIFLFFYNRNGFRHPNTCFIPKPLRHTWLSGLCVITTALLVCLPGWMMGYYAITTIGFATSLLITRKKGVKLLIDDLKLHKMDGRSLLEHSEDCYMTEGKTATFFKKRRERLQKNPKPIFKHD